FGAAEIRLGDEVVVRAREAGGHDEAGPSAIEQLPFLVYRDGIRRMFLSATTPRAEADALLECLRCCSRGPDTQDDLVTLLWQANLSMIRFEAVPLERMIYLSSRPGGGAAQEERHGQMYAWTPTGSEIRSELGQAMGAQGLHKDTFDDWDLPEAG